MERKTALIGAAVMTGVIALAFLILGASAYGRTNTNTVTQPAADVAAGKGVSRCVAHGRGV